MTYQEGDPNHIGVHNDLVTQVGNLADQMSVSVDLPPVVSLGQTGHVDHHNQFTTAINKIAARAIPGPQPRPRLDEAFHH